MAVDPAADDQVSEVWGQTQAQLRAFLARLAPVSADVDDLLQETFIKMYQAADRLDEVDQIDAWLYRIARNVLIDHGRSPRSKHETPFATADDQAPGPSGAASESSIEDETASRRELAACIRPMLSALPGDQRTALELTDLGELSQVEAASAEGVSVSGMKSRVQRGRHRLRAELTRCCRVELDRRGAIIDHQPVPTAGSDECCPPLATG